MYIFMEVFMPNINDEMKATAEYAIKAANQRFKQDLDYSEESIPKLDKILEQIYWGFSNHPKDEGEGGVIYNAAIIWGSYLGEYMRLKWGGTWMLKGSEELLSIKNIEFSPISLVYQKITRHPEYSVENYVNEAKSKVHISVFNPQESQAPPKTIDQPKKEIPSKPSKIPVKFDKRLLFSLAGIVGILLVIVACIIGYSMIRSGGISAFGSIASATSSYTNIPIEKTLVTATAEATDTPDPTVTPLPTYIPLPTDTQSPSLTPSLTYSQIASLTPTETQTPVPPTRTRAPTRSPTSGPIIPTNPPVPPTVPPATTTQPPLPTPTKPPPPTATQPPPIVIASCEINPSTVPAGNSVTISFIVHFSSGAPGYGFSTVFNQEFPGQSGCSGNDDNGDSIASCDGSSGLLPSSTSVDVTFISSVGNCVASYRSQ
jgi:hypothetical protein